MMINDGSKVGEEKVSKNVCVKACGWTMPLPRGACHATRILGTTVPASLAQELTVALCLSVLLGLLIDIKSPCCFRLCCVEMAGRFEVLMPDAGRKVISLPRKHAPIVTIDTPLATRGYSNFIITFVSSLEEQV